MQQLEEARTALDTIAVRAPEELDGEVDALRTALDSARELPEPTTRAGVEQLRDIALARVAMFIREGEGVRIGEAESVVVEAWASTARHLAAIVATYPQVEPVQGLAPDAVLTAAWHAASNAGLTTAQADDVRAQLEVLMRGPAS